MDIEESPPKFQHLVIDEDCEMVDRICFKGKWEIKESSLCKVIKKYQKNTFSFEYMLLEEIKKGTRNTKTVYQNTVLSTKIIEENCDVIILQTFFP